MWSRSENSTELGQVIFITVAHIPGILNVEADQASRKSELRIKWKLHESIFCYIKRYLDVYQSVDLFASEINAQLPQVFAYWPHPKAAVMHVMIHRIICHFTVFLSVSTYSEGIIKDNFQKRNLYIICPKLAKLVLICYLARLINFQFVKTLINLHLLDIICIYQITPISNILSSGIWILWHVWCQGKIWQAVQLFQ